MRHIGFLMCLVVLFVGSCSDKPSQPPEPEPEPQNYAFVAFSDRMKMYTYHPESRELDSTDVPYRSPYGVTVSPDGKRLYIVHVWNFATVVGVLDAETLELLAQLPYFTREPVAVSPDNKMIAIVGQDLHILSTSDYSEIYSDTNSAAGGVFSADSRSFYCASGGKACKIDLSGPEISKTIWDFAGGLVAHVVPTPDGSILFAYNHGPNAALSVYDLERDSVLFVDRLLPGGGMVRLSPDGRYAFYNDPGGIIGGTIGFQMKAFDIESCEVVLEITTNTTFDDSLPLYYLATEWMEVSPDSRWLALLETQARMQMLLFDIENMELVDYAEFSSWLGNLSAAIK